MPPAVMWSQPHLPYLRLYAQLRHQMQLRRSSNKMAAKKGPLPPLGLQTTGSHPLLTAPATITSQFYLCAGDLKAVLLARHRCCLGKG